MGQWLRWERRTTVEITFGLGVCVTMVFVFIYLAFSLKKKRSGSGGLNWFNGPPTDPTGSYQVSTG